MKAGYVYNLPDAYGSSANHNFSYNPLLNHHFHFAFAARKGGDCGHQDVALNPGRRGLFAIKKNFSLLCRPVAVKKRFDKIVLIN